MRKKVFSLLLAACLAVGMLPTTGGVAYAETLETLSDGGQCQQMYEGSNINAQNYGNSYPYWSSPVESYLVPMSDGGTMRVQAGDHIEGILVEYYDADHNAQVARTKVIPEELPIFGGFYATSDAYYVLTGQNNPDESADVEVYRITKYDTNWNRVGSDGLKNCNTTKPFDAGSARMEAYGDYLLVRTSHEMYQSSDGLNHQSNVTIQLDMRTMEITDSYTQVMNTGYGYVSHSFNQFLHVEDGHIIAVDHGDAHPRSAVLIKYPTDVTSGKFTTGSCSVTNVMTFPDVKNYNDTGSSVGAFELSASSYLIAGNSGIKEGVIGETHNVFVAAVDKQTDEVTTNWLTNFAEGDGTTSTPHMVKLSDNRFVVLWTRGQNVCYVEVNGEGQAVSSTYSMKGELSDCAPVVSGGNITWYTWRNDVLTFYDINTSDLSSNQKTDVVAGHQYEVIKTEIKTEGGISTLRCSVCGTEKQVAVYNFYGVYWNEDDGTGSYSTGSFSGEYNVGDVIYFEVANTREPSDEGLELNQEWTIDVSDEDKVLCTITYDGHGYMMGYFTMLSSGTATLSFCPRYNPDNKQTFSLNIASDPVSGIEVSPTILELLEGTTGQLETTVTPDSADQSVTFSSSDNTVATVSGEGLVTAVKAGTATITVTAADQTHTAQCTVTVTAHEHTFDDIWHKDETGHWHQCTQDTVRKDEAAHSMREVIDQAATEEQTGRKHEECTVCGYTGAEIEIPKLDHTHAMTYHAEVAATCTQAGVKAYYACSKCGKSYSDEAGNLEITDLVIAALGHRFQNYNFDEGSASCTEDGTETAKCDRCDVTDTRTAEGTKLPHVMAAWTTTVEPTCTVAGTKTRKCQNCDYTESDEIAALGHSWEEVLDRPATEEQTGLKHQECTVCHEKGEETEIPKLDHTHVMTYHEGADATCTESGTKAYYVCSKCGNYYSDETGSLEIADPVIPALGHSFQNYNFDEGSASCTADGTETAKCDRCDVTDTRTAEGTKLPHEMSAWTVVNPTCTEAGSRSRNCQNCDYTESEEIAALGHKWSEVVTWAEDYSHAEVTADCENDPNHTETHDAVITVKDTSTCVDAGVITYTGTVTLSDGTVFTDSKTEEGAALGHSFSNYVLNSDKSETAKCDRCSETDTRKSNIQIKDETNVNVKVDIGGLDLNKTVENLAQHDVEVILHQETASDKNVTELAGKVDGDYESAGTFEIKLLLSVDGKEQGELTEEFGSVQLSLSVGATYAGKKAVVYQLHGNEIILHSGLTVDANGNVTFKIDKLSSFMVAVQKDEPVQDSSDDDSQETENVKATPAAQVYLSPKTEESISMSLWVSGLALASAFVCAILAGVKKKQKS
ncbi:MAG: Ig-like domain-containing protein [Candidatus Gastranaerophilales bacterium]|nr:Ig-like domain-containing protein [Candidatus Gastranaerophilales bacterium]